MHEWGYPSFFFFKSDDCKMFSTTVLSRLIKDSHTFQSTSVYIHVIRCGRARHSLVSPDRTSVSIREYYWYDASSFYFCHLRMVKNVAHCLLHCIRVVKHSNFILNLKHYTSNNLWTPCLHITRILKGLSCFSNLTQILRKSPCIPGYEKVMSFMLNS